MSRACASTCRVGVSCKLVFWVMCCEVQWKQLLIWCVCCVSAWAIFAWKHEGVHAYVLTQLNPQDNREKESRQTRCTFAGQDKSCNSTSGDWNTLHTLSTPSAEKEAGYEKERKKERWVRPVPYHVHAFDETQHVHCYLYIKAREVWAHLGMTLLPLVFSVSPARTWEQLDWLLVIRDLWSTGKKINIS